VPISADADRSLSPINRQARIRQAIRETRQAGGLEPRVRPVRLRRRRRGLPAPRFETALPTTATHTFGPLVAAWAKRAIGLELLAWQRDALDWALACDASGELAHRHVLISTARQNGKTSLARAIIGFAVMAGFPSWLVTMGLAYDRGQAHRLYMDVLFDVEPLAGAYVSAYAGIRGPRGRLYNVASREARHNLRGLSIDLAVFDEASLQVTDDVWAALLPTMVTRPDAFALGLSTAGTDRSVLLRRWYELGRAMIARGDAGGFGLLWYGAGDDDDPDDPLALAAANPARVDGLLKADAIAYERAASSLDVWNRERLNRWTTAESAIVPAWAWAALARPDAAIPAEAGRIVLAVDAVSSWQRATIAVAGYLPETGRPHIAIADELVLGQDRHHIAPKDVIERLAEAVRVWRPAAIVFDAGAAIAPHLEGAAAVADWPLVGLNRRQVAGASMHLEALILGGDVTQSGDVVLAVHLAAAAKSMIGDSWRLSRRQSTGHIDAIVAGALAVYALTRPAEAKVDLAPQVFL
jgi:hypothetical protein